MIIESVDVLNDVSQGEPLLVLLSVEKPCTCLPMQIDYQVKDELEESQGEFHAL